MVINYDGCFLLFKNCKFVHVSKANKMGILMVMALNVLEFFLSDMAQGASPYFG